MERIITGVRVQSLTMDAAVRQGLELLEAPGVHWGFTPNPKLLSMACADDELRKILNQASLSLPDGVGVLLAARLTGRPLPARVTGADYALSLARAAGQRGKRLYLLGGKPDVARRAGKTLSTLCPGLILAGTGDGYFADAHSAAEAVRQSGADLVYVCLGCPRQEQWIAQYGGITGARLLLGLGGTLDVLCGDVRRAPAAVQTLGLEWLWRSVCQPERLRELWRLPLFLAEALAWAGKER